MHKKLIALAVAAAVASPMAASAEVKIYGKMHASWDFIDTNDAANDDSDDQTGVHRASRLGFKGSEDLGDGLSAIWQVETQVNAAGNGLALRNTFVGLKGGWGQVRMGRHDTPYKIATGKLDIFGDTVADYNNIISARAITGTPAVVTVNRNVIPTSTTAATTATASIVTYSTTTAAATAAGATVAYDERVPQTVAYITPVFNGFHGAIARVSHKINEGPNADENEAWSLMGMYENGPLFVSLAYETHEGAALGGVTGSASTATNDSDAWKLGLGYKFGSSKIGFVYEDMDHEGNNNPADRDAWLINFAHKFGMNTFKISYGSIDDSAVANANDGADSWAVGLDHAFSKRTSIYAIYATMDNDSGAGFGLNSGNQVGGGAAASGAGNDVDVFSLGVVHKF